VCKKAANLLRNLVLPGLFLLNSVLVENTKFLAGLGKSRGVFSKQQQLKMDNAAKLVKPI
jgi:hypothetical protein